MGRDRLHQPKEVKGILPFFSRVDTADRRRSLFAAAPALAALIVYAITLGAGFLYDDELLIRTNRWVQDGHALLQLPFKPLLASPPMGTTNYYRPAVVVLYNLTWQSLGGSPLAFHLLNVALHMLNATLVFQLVRRLSGSKDSVAFGAALLFAVHPLNVEVVAWPSCLPELSYVAFGLAALLLHMAAWTRPNATARRFRMAAYALFALACSCKETAVAFVPLIVLLELWLRPRPAGGKSPKTAASVSAVVPYIAAAAVYSVARIAVLGGLAGGIARGSHSATDALWNAPWLLLLYVKAMILPSPLLVEHVIALVTSPADTGFLLGAVAAAAGVAAIIRLRRKDPDLAFAACLTLVPLLPALYLPALGRDPFAERYAYLAVAGFCWFFVGGVERLTRQSPIAQRSWALPAFACALAIVAGARSVARCGDWHDDGTLGAASMRDEPRAPIGYLLAGNWANREGRKDEALRIFERGAVQLPDNVELPQNAIALGLELGRKTQADATAAYEQLAPKAAGNASAQYNLGQSLLQSGRLDEAEAAFTRSLELSPASVASMTALAVVASQKGDFTGSVALCRRALAVDARATATLQQLGVALMRTGDVPGAVAALENAMQLDPADKETLNRLGVAYARSGRFDDARRVWERALAIDPGFAGARQNLERLRQKTR